MNKSIGIIGGGQLAKMLIESNDRWLYDAFNVLESDNSNSLCNDIADYVIRGNLHDSELIKELADKSDVITYEIEDINVNILEELHNKGKTIIPYPSILSIIKDKGKQKQFFRANNIPTSPFTIVDNISDCLSIISTRDKTVIKSCVGGYDGKGVHIVDSSNLCDIIKKLNSPSYVMEDYIKCKKELSIIVAIDTNNDYVVYPIVETVFNEDNVLDYQICPVELDNNISNEAKQIAVKTALAFNSPGLFAVELFLDENNEIYVNEVSPRPHNTGHHTIECSVTSQFQQLNRILLGQPLRSPDINKSSIMVNILGPDNYTGKYNIDTSAISNTNNCHIHIYGKNITRPGRKLGHVTITSDIKCNSKDLIKIKDTIINKIKIIPTISNNEKPIVGVIMGSISDWPIMKDCCEYLDKFGVIYEKHIVSAHRTPDKLYKYATTAYDRGIRVIIAGAGGAAHLPGMCASLTSIPIIGVPIKTSILSGVDSLHSIVQMPKGVPVATVAINGSINSAILATEILSVSNDNLYNTLSKYKKSLKDCVKDMETTLHDGMEY